MTTELKDFARAMLDLTWSEMDDFCGRIVEAATDDNGEPNDARYIAQILVAWAREIGDD